MTELYEHPIASDASITYDWHKAFGRPRRWANWKQERSDRICFSPCSPEFAKPKPHAALADFGQTDQGFLFELIFGHELFSLPRGL